MSELNDGAIDDCKATLDVWQTIKDGPRGPSTSGLQGQLEELHDKYGGKDHG